MMMLLLSAKIMHDIPQEAVTMLMLMGKYNSTQLCVCEAVAVMDTATFWRSLGEAYSPLL